MFAVSDGMRYGGYNSRDGMRYGGWGGSKTPANGMRYGGYNSCDAEIRCCAVLRGH